MLTCAPTTALPTAPAARRLSRVLTASGLALVPWMAGLAVVGLRWCAAWVGLDALEALGLVASGLLLGRGDRRCSLTAAATATLLVADAWFDTTTAAPGLGLVTAVASAACLELPLAALCTLLSARTFTPPTPAPTPAPTGGAALTGPTDVTARAALTDRTQPTAHTHPTGHADLTAHTHHTACAALTGRTQPTARTHHTARTELTGRTHPAGGARPTGRAVFSGGGG